MAMFLADEKFSFDEEDAHDIINNSNKPNTSSRASNSNRFISLITYKASRGGATITRRSNNKSRGDCKPWSGLELVIVIVIRTSNTGGSFSNSNKRSWRGQ